MVLANVMVLAHVMVLAGRGRKAFLILSDSVTLRVPPCYGVRLTLLACVMVLASVFVLWFLNRVIV